MNIATIFDVVTDCLYAVQFEGEEKHEFSRLFELWNDVEYLEAFFEMQQKELANEFWNAISVEDAVLKTIRDARKLERRLIQVAEVGKIDKSEALSSFFKPLHDSTTKIEPFEKNKAKGINTPNWLRIYAIRLDNNLFVISGGGIKLTKTMQESEHLLLELKKMELVKEYLQNDDNSDLPIFELF